MKYYNISQVKESGTYFRNDTFYIKIKITDAETLSVTSPSEVSVTIINPCDKSIVTNKSMTSDATGYYYYEYDLGSNAKYGLYNVNIKTQNKNQLVNFMFVVFPFDVCSMVRDILSAYQQNDISDYKLALLAWESYLEVLDEIYEFHYMEKPLSNPSDGSWFDGKNKTFQLKQKLLADHNGDGVITGYGELDCEWDVIFYWFDENYNRNIGHVSVLDCDNGLVELKTDTDEPVPDTVKNVYVTYWERSKYYDENIMRDAVAYLTAYKIAMTFKSLNKTTLADIQTNRLLDAEKFKNKYEELISIIGFNNIGCGR